MSDFQARYADHFNRALHNSRRETERVQRELARARRLIAVLRLEKSELRRRLSAVVEETEHVRLERWGAGREIDPKFFAMRVRVLAESDS